MLQLFSLFGIIALVYEIRMMFNTEYMMELNRKAITMVRDEDSHIFLIQNDAGKYINARYLKLALLQLGYMLWSLGGLFTDQWIIFAAFLIWSFVFGILASKMEPSIPVWVKFMDALLSVMIIGFFLINTWSSRINSMEIYHYLFG